MFSVLAGLTRGLSTGLATALSAAATLAICFVLFSLWNSLWDNPRVAKAARAEYVRIADYEKVRAERDTAKKLLLIEVQTTAKLEKQVAGFAAAQTMFERARQTANSQTEVLQDELEELAGNRQGDVPRLDDLGILERLRNR